MLDKVQRVQKLAPVIGAMLGLEMPTWPPLERSAALFKSDLVTQMVVELTSLQGSWAASTPSVPAKRRLWPTRSMNTICRASRGMRCRPPGLGWCSASQPSRFPGRLFSVGLAPTSTADPFGLRREALGLVQALIGSAQPLDLRKAVSAAAGFLPARAATTEGSVDELQVLVDVLAFVRDRLYGVLRDQGLAHDVVRLRCPSGDMIRTVRVAARELAGLWPLRIGPRSWLLTPARSVSSAI